MAKWQELARQAAVVFDEGKLDDAMELARQALRLNPRSAMAHQVIGLTHARRDEAYEAIDWLTRALAIQPDLVPAHCDLGVAYTILGDAMRAQKCFENALRLKPDHSFSRFNRAQTLLQTGKFREGWLEYEWRWHTGQVAWTSVARPRWDGRSLEGKTILVHAEQGLGDTIQFVRLLPLLKQQGARVLFACQAPLCELLDGMDGVDGLIPIGNLQQAKLTFDWYCPLMSLPGLLGIDTEADIPKHVPYITADAERIERWRPRLDALPGLKIGLNWQGKPTQRKDRLRSMPLEKFAPLARCEGVSLVSIQKGAGESQIGPNRRQAPLTVLHGLDADAAFVDTAAVMMLLDLIVSTDTSIVHLAGALGRPVWVPLSTAAEWRFMLDRTDSPWYPAMRLFRQPRLGDWESVIRDIVEAVTQLRDAKA